MERKSLEILETPEAWLVELHKPWICKIFYYRPRVQNFLPSTQYRQRDVFSRKRRLIVNNLNLGAMLHHPVS